MGDGVRVVIGFDGSEHARRAIEHAGRLFGGATATVVAVWEELALAAARHGMTGPLAADTIDRADAAGRGDAEALAQEGERLARAAGLQAGGEVVEAPRGVWRAIAAAADRHDADVVVVGARGRGDVASAILGSVSHALLAHVSRPVLVVPPPRDAGA